MKEIVIAVMASPLLIVITTFLLTEVVKPRLKAPPAPAQAAAAQSVDWADRAYSELLARLEDERDDHARTRRRHRACHDAMRAAGLDVPTH